MLKDLQIPRMGSVENAKLVAWIVEEGSSFSEGELLYEIETDKTTTEVEATEDGILARQLAQPGDEFKVGDLVGKIAPPGTSSEAIAKALGDGGADAGQAPLAPSDDSASKPVPSGGEVAAAGGQASSVRPIALADAKGKRVSPLARRLAALHEVNIADVSGTGPRGKITGDDILEAAAQSPAAGGSAPAAPAAPAAAPAPAGLQPKAILAPASVSDGSRRIEHSMRRRTIARRMVEGYSIPTLTADMDVELTALRARRNSESGKKPSVLGFVAYATVQTIKEFPEINAHYYDDAIVVWDSINLGIAVDTKEGLVVPVIKDAQWLDPLGLTEAIATLAAKARDGKLTHEDLEGGTFTISNPGSVGPVRNTEAILNPPQVALLGLPGIRQEVRPIRDGSGWSMAVREILQPSLSFDHRALDGGPVVSFLTSLKNRIESL